MKRLLFVLFAATILFGCSKEVNIPSGEYGTVSVGLASEGEFTSTKTENVNVQDFYVKFLREGSVAYSYESYSQMPNSIEITPGTYTIEAGSKGTANAAWDQPIYYGSKEFTINAGDVLALDLTCSLSNMKVTVTYTEEFAAEINDNFEIAITNGVGTLIYTKSIIDAATSGYFSVGTLTIDLTATRRGTGEEILEHRVIEGGAAKDHFTLNFNARLTGEVTVGSSGITIDYTLNQREESITIPGEDETPVEEPTEPGTDPGTSTDPEQPQNEYLPLIAGNGIEDSPIPISDAAGESLSSTVVDIEIATQNSKTIDDILVTISGPEQFTNLVTGMGLGGEFSIVDFADDNGAARKTTLMDLGLIADPTISPIKGQTQYTFSIGGFMYPLTLAADPVDQVSFTIKVVDSESKEASGTCTINVVE